jgi:epoxyqueuosine reductase QueG
VANLTLSPGFGLKIDNWFKMEHPVLNSIRRASFASLGWFEPKEDDGVPYDAKFVILIGNFGSDMFRRFAREKNSGSESMDVWTKDTIDPLATSLDAQAVYPFDKPYLPFLTWARRAGAGHISPLGLNVHPIYGLWHAYRAALLFPVVFDLPVTIPTQHPCETCADRPCLATCPVGAFDGMSYDVTSCTSHLQTDAQTCLTLGCKARLACPVGRSFIYSAAQIDFHMRAFMKAREPTI